LGFLYSPIQSRARLAPHSPVRRSRKIMLRLCGAPSSNYYNKVKFVLLEKGLSFEEELVAPSQDQALLERSPLGKVPFLETDSGTLRESQVIIEYLEAAYPGSPLLPADPFEAARQRELVTFVDWHLEMVARRIYLAAFSGASVAEDTKEEVRTLLRRHIAGFKQLVVLGPYLGGAAFGLADIAGFISLPLVGMATRALYGSDFLLDAGLDLKAYLGLVGQRPAAQRVTAERKAFAAARAAQRDAAAPRAS
jgi:glutathione S-transferase